MIRFVDLSDGTAIDLDSTVVECTCPQCGECHTIDVDTLAHAVQDGESVLDLEVSCAACTKAMKLDPRPSDIDLFRVAVAGSPLGE